MRTLPSTKNMFFYFGRIRTFHRFIMGKEKLKNSAKSFGIFEFSITEMFIE